AEGPQTWIAWYMPGQLDSPESAHRQPEQHRQRIARRHQPAFVTALNALDLGVDRIDRGNRIGCADRPGEGSTVCIAAPGETIEGTRHDKARFQQPLGFARIWRCVTVALR